MHSPYNAYRREPAWITQPSLLRAIAVRPRMLLLVTGAVFALFAVLILTLPKGYESHMKLRLGSEDDSRFSNPADVKGPTAKSGDTLGSRMNLEMDVLKSADTLTQVVLKTGLQKCEVAEDQSRGETSPLTVEKALERLQQDLKIDREGESNIVDVTYSGPTGEMATATLRSLAAIYPKVRVKVYGEPGKYKFLHRQSVVWRQQMDEAENDLVHFRRRYSEFVLPEERDALGKQSVEAQAAFEQADAQVAQYRKKVAEAREKLKAISPAIAERNRMRLNTDAVGRAVMMLVDLIGRRADLNSRAVPDRQSQQEADERIRNAKLELNRSLSRAAGDKTVDLSTVGQHAEMDLISSETELAGLEALRNHLRHTAQDYKEQMFRLADAEVRDGALLRQVKQTEEQYLLYSRWQEQAIASEGLAKESIFNFGIVQQPTIPVEPSTPRVALDLALSFLLSVCCGLAVVLCAEYLTPSALGRYAAVRTIPVEFQLS